MRLIGTAASGIRAQQMALDTIGNNMANVGTPGFKANGVNFAETLATQVLTGDPTIGGNPSGAPLSTGVGVMYNPNRTDFQQGTLVPSDSPLDIAIKGSGFFQIKNSNGVTGYTRAGNFQVDASGLLVDVQGNIVQPGVSIPLNATELSVASNGEISGTVKGVRTSFGQISLAVFENPEGLQNDGNNVFLQTVNSGAPQFGNPGSSIGNLVLGTLQGNSLEQSNVDLATSMTELIKVQRAYQLNGKMVQNGDQMWSIANAMRR